MCSAENGRGQNYKVRFRLKLLRYKSRISLKRKTLLLLTARWRAGPFEGLVRPRGSPASGPLTRILSPASRLRSPGHQRRPFSFPWERNYRFPPLGGPLSKRPRFPCPPPYFPPKVLPPAS